MVSTGHCGVCCGMSRKRARAQTKALEFNYHETGTPMLDHLIDDDDVEPIADHRFTHTDAMAGSIEKIEVLAYRAANFLPLWHEHDNPETMPPARELRFGKSQKKFMPGVD